MFEINEAMGFIYDAISSPNIEEKMTSENKSEIIDLLRGK